MPKKKKLTTPSVLGAEVAGPSNERGKGNAGPDKLRDTSEVFAASSEVAPPSEDELRTKVLYPFLRDHRFSPEDVKIEFSFPIRIGRSINKRPRTDALITKNGLAIFVIECKREDFVLTQADQEQAISYARLVQPQMPPYAILTNGRHTIILDTFLGTRVPPDKLIAMNGLVSSPAGFEEAVRLRYLANKHLLSLSSTSLASFLAKDLEEQIRFHSKGSLRPPYSPATHIPRTDIWSRIEDFCRSSNGRILPVVGPATIGKSSEIFSWLQQYLARAESDALPLYLPLNLAGPNFLPFLAENFGWAFGQQMNVAQLIHDIDEIAHAQNKSCVAYILDGADFSAESLTQLRREILNLLRRSSGLSCHHKVIVVAQEATWLRLISGQAVDLGGFSEEPIRVDRLTQEQTVRHIRALEEFYSVRILNSGGPAGQPAFAHMLARQLKDASSPGLAARLDQLFRSPGAVRNPNVVLRPHNIRVIHGIYGVKA